MQGPTGRNRLIAFAAAIAVGVGVLGAVSPSSGQDVPPAARAKDPNVCLDKEIIDQRGLRCPDLRMRPPFDIHRDKVGNKPVLRAANSINSVGKGPVELRGTRDGKRSMRAIQRVRKQGGKKAKFKTGARLYFKAIPGQGRYWKYRDAARFALWLLDKQGDRVRRVEVGPKAIYCLRDLEHTHPGMNNSPDNPQYPACNQDPGQQRVTLGTSVGWSDVYPHTYHEQWIELNDIPKRGCYAYVHIADPNDGVYERKENNNEASTVVFLTPSGRYKPNKCRGVRDRALPPSQTVDDSELSDDGAGPYRVTNREVDN